jgi:hypothetical protein
MDSIRRSAVSLGSSANAFIDSSVISRWLEQEPLVIDARIASALEAML